MITKSSSDEDQENMFDDLLPRVSLTKVEKKPLFM